MENSCNKNIINNNVFQLYYQFVYLNIIAKITNNIIMIITCQV